MARLFLLLTSCAALAAAQTGPEPPSDLPPGAVARVGSLTLRHGSAWLRPALHYSPDGKHLISTGGWVRRWDAATGKLLATVGDGGRQANGYLPAALVTTDGRTARVLEMLPKYDRGESYWPAKEFDLTTGKEVAAIRVENPSATSSDGYSIGGGVPTILSPDGKYLLTIGFSGVLVHDAATGRFLRLLETPRPGGRDSKIAFDPTGTSVLVGEATYRFRLFDLKGGQQRQTFSLDAKDSLRLMAISPDGKWLATFGKSLRLWDLSRGEVVRTIA